MNLQIPLWLGNHFVENAYHTVLELIQNSWRLPINFSIFRYIHVLLVSLLEYDQKNLPFNKRHQSLFAKIPSFLLTKNEL